MRTLTLITFLILLTCDVHSQTAYFTKVRDAFTISASTSKQDDNIGYGIDFILTNNSRFNIGVGFGSFENTSTSGDVEAPKGSSFSAYLSYAIASQTNRQPVNLEWSFLFSRSKFNDSVVRNTTIGFDLTVSRLVGLGRNVLTVPQMGFSIVPFSRTYLGEDRFGSLRQRSDFIVFHLSNGFALRNKRATFLGIEPGFSYNITDDLFSVSVAMVLFI